MSNQEYAGETALVTGAGGFLGSAVARALLAEGTPVRVLLRAGSDHRNVDGLEVERCIGDLRDAASLRAALDGCDALYHVAADYRLWVRNPHELYDSNVEGTRNVMQAALTTGVPRVVYTSSVATLGLVQFSWAWAWANVDAVSTKAESPGVWTRVSGL